MFEDWYLDAIWKHKCKLSILHKIITAYIKRILNILSLSSQSVVYIEKELLPYMPSWLEYYLKIRNIPFIVDYDDAIFHNYDNNKRWIIRWLFGAKICKVISYSSLVICGCRYLANYASKRNSNTVIIPTSINADLYNIKVKKNIKPIVGWIGSPSSSKFINVVVPAIKELQEKIDFDFWLIGFDKSKENYLQGINYKIIEWREDNEVDILNCFDIGIMPLEDTPFSRGKCAFKLVQYMSVGVPTISTPLLSNLDIDKGCGNLFATNTEEWKSALESMLSDKNLRLQIGKRNKMTADKYYTFQCNASTYIKLINTLIKR